jgi:hypothetical protein
MLTKRYRSIYELYLTAVVFIPIPLYVVFFLLYPIADSVLVFGMYFYWIGALISIVDVWFRAMSLTQKIGWTVAMIPGVLLALPLYWYFVRRRAKKV